jgi:hypothetical protein
MYFALLTMFSLSTAPTFAAKTMTNAAETSTEATNKLSETEISNYRARVEEIRDMDKSDMSATEKKELKSELKDIKETMHRDGTYFYVGGSTLLIIILILILI